MKNIYKSILLIALICGSFTSWAQSPVIISAPYKFQKWISVNDYIELPGLLPGAKVNGLAIDAAGHIIRDTTNAVLTAYKLKVDSVLNGGYVTHGYFNSHGIYTASQGITKTGNNFTAGGNFTNDISFLSNNNSQFAVVGQDGTGNNADIAVTGNFSAIYTSDNNSNTYGMQSGITNSVVGRISLNKFQALRFRNNQIQFVDSVNARGPVAGGNYEANYQPLSYTSKKYVDSVVNLNGGYTSSNGITKTLNNFTLGGPLTGNTTIPTAGHLFAVGDVTNFNSLLYVSPAEKIFQGYSGDATFRSNIALSPAAGGAFYIATTDVVNSKEISMQGDLTNGIVIMDGKFNRGITHDATVNHATWTNSTYVDKKYADSVAALRALPDSTLHPNKNLYDVVNKATARTNLGVLAIPDTLSVGNLYNQTTWNNFNDFTAQGNYTLVNGNIHITAAQSDVLSTNYVTSLSSYTESFTYRATNGLSNAAGVRFGLKSINVVSAAGFQFWFDETTRKINLFNVSTSVTTTGASVLPAYTPGDLLTISVTYTNPTIIFIVKNLTTGQSISYSGSSLITMNRSNISIYAQNTSVEYDIQNITLYTPYRNGGNLFVGDSIENGASATPGNGYTFQLNGQIEAGNGDYTVPVVASLSEIIKLKPETVYLKIGTNDSFINIWQANIVSIVSTLENAGIRIVLISPPPRNTVDMTPYLTFLQAQYPTQTIDIFTPLKAVSGTGYNPAYDSGDGVHPNQAGHNLIASTVSGTSLWHTAVYSKVISPTYLASRLTNTTVTPGYYDGLSTFKVRGDGRIENASSLGVQTTLGALYYTSARKIGVSSQVTINGSAVVANTFYGNSTWAATSQGTNSLSFLTASNSNLVARMFNSGGMTVGVGLTADPGANVLSVAGPVLANSFYGTSNWTATAQGTNFLSFLTQSNSHLVARMFDSGGMTIGFGLSADPGANTLSVAGGTIAARFQGQSTASLTSVGTNLVQIATQSNANVVGRHFDSGGATIGLGLSTDPGANSLRVGSNIMGQSFSLLGNASGQININAQNAAGTYNFNMPITAGTAGQVLTSQAGGSTAMTWTTPVGFANPMTTLGDIVYGGASGAATRLAGNTATSKLFLTSTGNGSVSAAPAYFDLFGTSNTWTGPVNIFNTVNSNNYFANSVMGFINVAVGPGSNATPHNLVLNATSTAGASNVTQTFQDKDGTVALTSDLPLSGSVSTTGTATTTFTVTIGSTQANTTYKVNATPTSLVAAAPFYITNKTTTTFDVVYLSGLTGAVSFDWSLFK